MQIQKTWQLESLEARQMLSAHHSKHHAPPLPPPLVIQAPAHSAKRRHAVAAPSAVFQVAGGIAGLWTGGQSGDNGFQGTLSLSVFQNKAGECYAILTFASPNGQTGQLQSQFVVKSDGQFALQVVSAKMAVKFTGNIFNHDTRTSSIPTMNGTLQYWDKTGTFKSQFVISPQQQG